MNLWSSGLHSRDPIPHPRAHRNFPLTTGRNPTKSFPCRRWSVILRLFIISTIQAATRPRIQLRTRATSFPAILSAHPYYYLAYISSQMSNNFCIKEKPTFAFICPPQRSQAVDYRCVRFAECRPSSRMDNYNRSQATSVGIRRPAGIISSECSSSTMLLG